MGALKMPRTAVPTLLCHASGCTIRINMLVLTLLHLSASLCLGLAAPTLYVSPTGTDASSCQIDPCEHVSFALTALGGNEGTIVLLPGVYLETGIQIRSLTVTLTGQSATFNLRSQGPAFLVSNANVTLQTLSIVNGQTGPTATGAVNAMDSSITASGCNFTNNVAVNASGAAISAVNTDLALTNCMFAGNRAVTVQPGGGAVYFSADATKADLTVAISGCTFSDNSVSATLPDPVTSACTLRGGAVAADVAVPGLFRFFVRNSFFIGNAIVRLFSRRDNQLYDSSFRRVSFGI